MTELTTLLIFLLGFWLGSKSQVNLEEVLKSSVGGKFKKLSNKLKVRKYEVFDNDEYAIEQEELEKEKAEKIKKEEKWIDQE